MASLEALEQRIGLLKTEHPKARHHCYGYRILFENGVREYSSDDGEPSGSAGKQILSAIKSAEFLNVGCVVVRYFGGTKLGIPGLIEAYRDSTKHALREALVKTVKRTRSYQMNVPMQLQPHILNACKKMKLNVSGPAYSTTFQLDIHIPLEHEEQTLFALMKMISGRDYNQIETYLDYLEIQLS